MFRQPVPGAILGLTLALAVLTAPAVGWSQDGSTQERLDRLERDLNMLQRQVYRGAPAPTASGDGGAAVNTEIRMERLEEQIRELTGRLEEVMNQVEQVKQRAEQINNDVEMRFSQGPSAPGPLGAAAAPSRPVPAAAARGAPSFPPALPDDSVADLSPPHAVTSARPGAWGPPSPPPGPPGAGPTPIFGTLTPPGSPPRPPIGAPELASAAPPQRPAATAAGLPNASPTEQYNRAFGLLKQADYPAAEAALKAFIEQHPKDPMAGNAQYWLGETYYTRGQYLEAASAFAEGYKRYPKSLKAPDGLLKLGMSLARANQKQNACVALVQLDHDFPHAGASVKERAAAEKKRLGC